MGDCADDTMNWEDEPGDHYVGDGGLSDQRLDEYIRGPDRFRRTSTYDPNSERARFGRGSEVFLVGQLNKLCPQGMRRVQLLTDKQFLTAREAIENSRNGDAVVQEMIPGMGWRRRRTLELKSSDGWPNVTISDSELAESEAEFIVALTVVKNDLAIWACTMESAREHSFMPGNARFWVVPRDRVPTVPLREVLQ